MYDTSMHNFPKLIESCGEVCRGLLPTYAAGVLALLSGAEHVVHDAPGGGVAVGVLALRVLPDLDGDLPENVGLRPGLLDAAPPHHGPGLVGVTVTARVQADGPHVVHLGHLLVQGDDGHVLVLEKYFVKTASQIISL